MNYLIESAEIGLTKTRTGELDFICEMERQVENSCFISFSSKEQHQHAIDNPDEEHLCVWDKSLNKIIGFILLAGVESANLSLEFRRIVITDKGKGWGRKCLQLIKKYCFHHLKFHRLWLDVFVDNERAIHLYKSEGFIEEGRLRDAVQENNNFRIFNIIDSKR